MDREDLVTILGEAPSPCFVVDEAALRRNLAVLGRVRREGGCRILLALKGFAMWRVFPLLRRTLDGICASGAIEARLGREEFDREVHTYAPAYNEADLVEVLGLTDHLVFNSFTQWKRFRPMVEAAPRRISCGLRINPRHSTGRVPIYDPCAPGSRLGIPREAFEGEALDGIDGLHFHTLCEQNADALASTLEAVEEQFGAYLKKDTIHWLNVGGGHHITRADYDVAGLIDLVRTIRRRYGVTVYLEPGEAVALNAGYLVATVLDIVENDGRIAILDTSATCHMPDVLEMPYRPEVVGAGTPGEKAHTYRLGGQSCLAGDVIGEYSFDEPLQAGNRILFTDMAHYSMVKTNTFNGVRLPSIATFDREEKRFEVVRRFGYEEYRDRLS